MLIFQPTVKPKASNGGSMSEDGGSKRVITILVNWEKDTVTGSGDIYIGVWEVEGVHSIP